MAAPDPIKIEGLREFMLGLRKIDGALPKGLKEASNKAALIVVNEAKPRVPVGPGKGGHASKSIKVASTAKAARISAGGKKFPYYAWLDFGGRVGPNKSVRRPFIKAGRYIWAAFDDKRADVERTLAEELEALARRAGMDPT